jgi:hypothetical protein
MVPLRNEDLGRNQDDRTASQFAGREAGLPVPTKMLSGANAFEISDIQEDEKVLQLI